MMRSFLFVFLFLSVSSLFCQEPAKKKETEAERLAKWDKDITAIETRLKQNPPSEKAIFFAGSSSVRMWDLKKSFPDWEAINVGFGGSHIRDSTYYADRFLIPFKPKTILFYAGDNDIGSNRSAKQVLADFKAFEAKIHASLPETRIYFLSVKPSIQRWKKFAIQTEANRLVQEFAKSKTNVFYIHTVPLLLGSDGMPIVEMYQKDGLHLTPDGYAAWNKVVIEALKK
jgi:hypothetical protein